MRRLALILILGACHTRVEGTTPVRPGPGPKPGEEIPAGGEPMTGVVVEAEPGAPPPHGMVGDRRRGAPHFAQIMGVVVDRAGKVAISKDALGSVRIWPALDGSREPQAVPVRSPEAMAIEARPDGSLAALIDGTGLTSLIRFDADGLVRATATLSPDVPLSGVVVLPGGERIVAVRSDQRISLLDPNGTELSRLAVRGGRVIALHAAGDRLVAVMRRMGEAGATTYELRNLTLTDDKLAWSGDAHVLAEPIASLPHVASALSPDGSLFAYVAGDVAASMLRVVRAESGAAIRLDGDVTTSFPGTTIVGFTGDRTVELAASNAMAWRIEIDGATGSAISSALGAGTSPPAFASHLRVVGSQAHLAIHADNGDVAYLGHRELWPSSGALSASGDAAAWITSSGALVIQRFDGSDDVRIKGPSDWFGSAAFIGDDHVVAGRSTGQLALFDSRTGAELATMVASTSTPMFQYEPSTKLLAVLRDTGVVWAIELAPTAARPFGKPIAIGDGAQTFTLLSPDRAKGAALMTLDAAMTSRSYTLAELRDGVTIAEMKKRRVAVGTSAWFFDRAGRHYVSNGTGVEIRAGADLVTTITVTNGASGIFPAPHGDRVAFTDSTGVGPLRAYNADGTELWASSAMKSVFSASWSADGTRVMVFGQGGGAILDATSGKPLIGAAGWAFGLAYELPTSFPPGLEPAINF